jgi:hypothetical protein
LAQGLAVTLYVSLGVTLGGLFFENVNQVLVRLWARVDHSY